MSMESTSFIAPTALNKERKQSAALNAKRNSNQLVKSGIFASHVFYQTQTGWVKVTGNQSLALNSCRLKNKEKTQEKSKDSKNGANWVWNVLFRITSGSRSCGGFMLNWLNYFLGDSRMNELLLFILAQCSTLGPYVGLNHNKCMIAHIECVNELAFKSTLSYEQVSLKCTQMLGQQVTVRLRERLKWIYRLK